MAIESDSNALEVTLGGCEVALGYTFQDRALLERCLTHASVARTRLDSNERLEFLGDAILGAVVCEVLFSRLPEEAEGELTRIKSIVVSGSTCAKVSRKLGLDGFLLLGKGLSTNDPIPESIIAAVFESLTAGIYLDGGMDAARAFVTQTMTPEIEEAIESAHGRNYKSLLQQIAQKTFSETPVYQLLDEKGPDHSKCFKVAAAVGERVFPPAWGTNKKEAEQRAAHNALQTLEGKELPHLAE